MAFNGQNEAREVTVWKIVLIYVAIGAAWIILSDRLVGILTPDAWSHAHIQTAKGIAYVLVTASILYLLLRRELSRWQESQREVRASERKYRQLFNTAQVGIVVHGSDGSILAANPTAEEILGLSETELTEQGLDYWQGKLFNEQRHELKREDFPIFRVLDSRAPLERILIGVRRPHNEEINWYVLSVTPLLGEKGAIDRVVSTFKDVSERKRAEEELRSSERLLQATIDALPSNIAVLDENGTIIRVNESWRRFGDENGLGWDDYGVGVNYLELIENAPTGSLQGAGEVLRGLRDLLSGERKQIQVEYPCHSPGRQRWFLMSGTPFRANGWVRVVLVHMDVTERKLAEEELRKSEQLLRETGRTARVGGWEVDVETNTVHWTQTTREIHEVPEDYEPSLAEAIEFFAPEARPALREALRRTREEGAPFDLELPFITAKGRRLWTHAIGEAEFREGRCVRLHGTFQDITKRKETEEKLRAAEEKYRMLAENTLDCIWQMSLPDLQFTYINHAIERMTGYSQEEWTGSRLPDHCDEEHWVQMSRIIEQEVSRPPHDEGIRFETQILDKDGASIDVEILGRVLYDEYGEPRALQGTTRDITERKRAEQALRKSETILTEAERLAHIGGWEWDIEEDTFVFSDEWQRIHGCDEPELPRDELLKIAHQEDLPAIERALQKALDGIEPYDVEHRIIRPDTGEERIIRAHGEVMWDETGTPVKMFGTAQDVTERKKTEERLRLRDRAIESSINGVALTDMQGKVVYVNPAALKMWGFADESEVVGRKAGEFWESRDAPGHALKLTIQKEGWEGEMTAQRKDGSTFPARVTMSLVKDDCGKATHVLGVFLDISREKKAFQELKKANERLEETLQELHETQQQLVHQERQRALTQMASGIAHDFNNALSTIQGFSDLLLQSPDKLADKETTRRYVWLINKAASNAAETVRRMRKFYRPGVDKPARPFDLNNLVDEAISMTEPRWREETRAEGLEVEVVRDLGEDMRVQGNEAELYEMLTNLIFNAVDALPEGGQIAFKTRRQGEEVLLEVSDTGVGMTPQVREHCLDPFFTTKIDTGTGLGLSTVQGVVRRHGGSIEVESQEGEGATFRIRLPGAEGSAEGGKEEADAESHATGLSVLVVEDEMEQRELIREYLELDGHEVYVATDGADGLAKFAEGWYDLVITDRSMPEKGGDEVALEVKKEAPKKPVIMLTGFGDMMDASGQRPEGVDLILSKPVNLAGLRDAIADTMKEQES